MYETAKQIRSELRKLGITSRMVSVACKPSYNIHVTTKECGAIYDVREIVKKCYYVKPHAWLCCWIDGEMLPLSNKTGDQFRGQSAS